MVTRILITVLSLIIILGAAASCSLVQESQAFEKKETEPVESNTDFLPSEPPTGLEEDEEIEQSAGFIAANPADLDIQKGSVSTFTARDTTKSTDGTEPAADSTPEPTPTPKPVTVLNFGSGNAGAPYTIRVFLDKQKIIVYGTNSDGQEVPIRSMVTSTGVRGKRTPQTGEKGSFRLGGGARWVKFSLMGSTTYHQYAKQFTGTDINGNNIGRHFFFHSTTYKVMRDPSSLDRTAYNRLGGTASSGCIRLNVADARFIYGLPGGTKVKILASSSGYNLKVNGLPKYTISKAEHNGWDPYDPDPNNRFGKIVLTAPGISGPKTMELTEGYAAAETAAFAVSGDPTPGVKVSGNKSITWDNSSKKLKIAKGLTAGTYEVTLTAASSAGESAAAFKLTVLKPETTDTIKPSEPTTPSTKDPSETTTTPTTEEPTTEEPTTAPGAPTESDATP